MVTVQLYLEPVQLIGVSSSHVAVISFGHEISARRMNNVKNLHLEFKLTVKRKTKQPKNHFLKLKKCMKLYPNIVLLVSVLILIRFYDHGRVYISVLAISA